MVIEYDITVITETDGVETDRSSVGPFYAEISVDCSLVELPGITKYFGFDELPQTVRRPEDHVLIEGWPNLVEAPPHDRCVLTFEAADPETPSDLRVTDDGHVEFQLGNEAIDFFFALKVTSTYHDVVMDTLTIEGFEVDVNRVCIALMNQNETHFWYGFGNRTNALGGTNVRDRDEAPVTY